MNSYFFHGKTTMFHPVFMSQNHDLPIYYPYNNTIFYHHLPIAMISHMIPKNPHVPQDFLPGLGQGLGFRPADAAPQVAKVQVAVREGDPGGSLSLVQWEYQWKYRGNIGGRWKMV